MSRYSLKLPNGRSIAWGFDRPLQEYFFQEYLSEKEQKDLPDEGATITDPLVFSISSANTLIPHPKYPDKRKWGNLDFLELMKDYPDIPTEHKKAIAFDLPF
jgi:hypothetical protein